MLLKMLGAVYKSILTFIGFSILALAFFSSNQLIPKIVGLLIMFAGFFVASYVFRLVRRRGYSEVSKFNYSTPDFDNLVPSGNTDVRAIDPTELSELLSTGKWSLREGILRIWGDWQGKQLDESKTIKDILYFEVHKKLELIFDEDQKITVLNPRNIQITTTYLKIIHADKVMWQWAEQSVLTYEIESFRIKRKTNRELNLDNLDVIYTQPAVMFKIC